METLDDAVPADAGEGRAAAVRSLQGSYAVFDGHAKLTGYTPRWLGAQSRPIRESIRPGLSFDELVDLELSCAPLSNLSDRHRDVWQHRRRKAFRSADGWALEFGSRRLGRVAIRCHRLSTGGTLTTLEPTGDGAGLESALLHQSTHDDLTGLLNRQGLEGIVQSTLDASADDGLLLCFMDLDQFQIINDTCGYEAGDRLLVQVARALEAEAGGDAWVARLGGDEFAVLLPRHLASQELTTARRLARAACTEDFLWEGLSFRVTTSVGVAHSAVVDGDARDLLRAADSACYAAKEGVGERIKLFSADDSTMNLRHGQMHWVARLNSALQDDRFALLVQPIVKTRRDGGDDGYLHFETLVRLNQRDGHSVSPGQFLPAAERYNLVGAIDRWVVSECIRTLEANPLFLDHLHTLAVNLSGRSVADPGFREWCLDGLRDRPAVARKLCFEITETAVMARMDQAQQFITGVRELGCRLALDDFGAGLSSFAYLKDLDVDYLKIDGQFVKDLDEDPVHEAMVRAIQQVAAVMGKKTVAEFVETDAVRDRLGEIGVDLVQGYLVGQPIDFAEVL